MKEKLIMLVDDDEMNNFVNTKSLKLSGHDAPCLVFEDPAMALEYLENKENEIPHIILLDINMPRITGWDFLEKIERLQLTSQVYMLSSSISQRDLIKAKSYAIVNGYIIKPLDLDMIAKIL